MPDIAGRRPLDGSGWGSEKYWSKKFLIDGSHRITDTLRSWVMIIRCIFSGMKQNHGRGTWHSSVSQDHPNPRLFEQG